MAEQLFQIGIKAIIRDGQGRLLLHAFKKPDGTIDMWDLPGGRMNAGEAFLQTLARELQEEIGVTYQGEPRHVMTTMANVTIPVGDTRVPLLLIVYEVSLLPGGSVMAVEQDSIIDWATPDIAAERLKNKFPAEFCTLLLRL